MTTQKQQQTADVEYARAVARAVHYVGLTVLVSGLALALAVFMTDGGLVATGFVVLSAVTGAAMTVGVATILLLLVHRARTD